MIGIPVSEEQLNWRVGQVVVALRNAFRDVEAAAAFICRVDDQTLAGFGYTADDTYMLRLAFERLDALRRAAYGEAAIPEPVDHFDPAANLTGLE